MDMLRLFRYARGVSCRIKDSTAVWRDTSHRREYTKPSNVRSTRRHAHSLIERKVFAAHRNARYYVSRRVNYDKFDIPLITKIIHVTNIIQRFNCH